MIRDMKKFLLYLLSFLIAGAIGFAGVYLFKLMTKPVPVQQPAQPVQVEQVTEVVQEDEPEPVVRVAEETVQSFELDLSGKKVSRLASGGFKVSGLRVKGGSGGAVKYILRDNENHLYESLDGNFEAEVAANARGYYNVVACDMKTGEATAAKALYGFKEVKQVERMSTSELEAMFNSGTSASMAPVRERLADKVKIKSNFPDVTTPSDVFLRVANEDLTVTVSSVHYDASGRADVITLELQ